MADITSAVLRCFAKNYSGTGAWLNEATVGTVGDGTINGAELRAHDGRNYVRFPGISGNNVSTSDHSDFDIIGNIDIRGWGAADDWTPAQEKYMISKWSTSQKSWLPTLYAAPGNLRLYWTEDGSTIKRETSTAAPSVSDGNEIGWRMTMRASDGACNFYTRTDSKENIDLDTGWSQLGDADISTAWGSNGSATSIHSGTAGVHIGGIVTDTGRWTGEQYRIIVCDGLGIANVVSDWDADDWAWVDNTSTYTENGHVWTLNHSAGTGYKAWLIDRQCFEFDSINDYIEWADHVELNVALAQSFTMGVGFRTYDLTSNRRLVEKRNDPNQGYLTKLEGSDRVQFLIEDSNSNGQNAFSAVGTDGKDHTAIVVRDRVADNIRSALDGILGTAANDNAVSTLENTAPFRVGTSSVGGSPFGGLIWSVAFVRLALAGGEVGTGVNTLHWSLINMRTVIGVTFGVKLGTGTVASSYTPNLTGNGVADDAFVVVAIITDADTTISTPSGWTAVVSDTGGVGTAAIFERHFSGAVSNPTFTFGVSTIHLSLFTTFYGVERGTVERTTAGNNLSCPTHTLGAGTLPSTGMWFQAGTGKSATVGALPSGWTTIDRTNGGASPWNISQFHVYKRGADESAEGGDTAMGTDQGAQATATYAFYPQGVRAPFFQPISLFAPTLGLTIPGALLEPTNLYAPTLGFTLPGAYLEPLTIYAPIVQHYPRPPFFQPLTIHVPQLDLTFTATYLEPLTIYAPEIKHVITAPYFEPLTIYAPIVYRQFYRILEWEVEADDVLEWEVLAEPVLEWEVPAEAVLEWESEIVSGVL